MTVRHCYSLPATDRYDACISCALFCHYNMSNEQENLSAKALLNLAA